MLAIVVMGCAEGWRLVAVAQRVGHAKKNWRQKVRRRQAWREIHLTAFASVMQAGGAARRHQSQVARRDASTSIMGSRLEQNSGAVRKRIASHRFEDEDGDEYSGSHFGGFADYFRRKKVKLQNLDADLRAQSPTRPQLFQGVVAHVNGYTQPSLHHLHSLIVQHGGGFLQYLDAKTHVTHIIASSLTPKKHLEFRRYRVVKPAWIVDTVRLGRLLPWHHYRLVDEGETQKVLALDSPNMTARPPKKPQGYRHESDSSVFNRSWFEQLEDAARTPTPTPASTSPRPDAPAATVTTTTDDDDKNSNNNNNDNDNDNDKNNGNDNKNGIGNNLTAEEHNAILLRDPRIRKSTVVDPNFLEQYYRESRLHHLSTWKAHLKSQLQALASEKNPPQKPKQKRPQNARRYILHVDFDSFFAAVSLKKYPQYKDKPAVVAHGNGSGSEIASCNYPARKFGIRNGMWMKRAQELCPDLKILPYDFPAYEAASNAFYNIVVATGGIVQSVSIDEALIDVSSLCISTEGSDDDSIHHEQAKAEVIAQTLRHRVKAITACNVSVGIGGNILLAKVALRNAKPAGQYQIKPEQVLAFIGQLQVQDLPGVAWSIGSKLEEIGIRLVQDIRQLTKERLMQILGPKTGEKLWEYSQGIDRQEVGEQVVRKSVSAEVNWGVRFENQEQADEFVRSLCGELQARLLKEKVKGSQFTMKIMRRSRDAPLDPPKHLGHGKCDTFNKSLILGIATNARDVLAREALNILKGFGISPGELRGIGVQMTRLEPMKSATDGNLESSQRRLQFTVGPTTSGQTRKLLKVAEQGDPIQDDPVTPKKPKATAERDHVLFGASELSDATSSRRPLNTMGTQFIMPTQVDSKVLAELPDDIRSKLLMHGRGSPTKLTILNIPGKTPTASPSRTLSLALTVLPAQSQLDPDILASLPPDVRAEILSQYTASLDPQSPSKNLKRVDQTILPQSPRKDRIIGIPAKRPIVPLVKRGRGRPPRSAQLAAAALHDARDSTGKTLTQANFISLKNPARGHRGSSVLKETSNAGNLDSDFLAALPENVRTEVVEEHEGRKYRWARLAIQKAQQLASHQHSSRSSQLVIVPRPARPTFTKNGLHDKNGLRLALKEWIQTFNEGPYEEDVNALIKYLGKVVTDEKDLGKAISVVTWLEWIIGDLTDRDQHFRNIKWGDAVCRVRNSVQMATVERGMGPILFI